MLVSGKGVQAGGGFMMIVINHPAYWLDTESRHEHFFNKGCLEELQGPLKAEGQKSGPKLYI
jgi:hypothetical protein